MCIKQIKNEKTNTLLDKSVADKIEESRDWMTNYFSNTKEEEWMKDIYRIITTSSLKNEPYQNHLSVKY